MGGLSRLCFKNISDQLGLCRWSNSAFWLSLQHPRAPYRVCIQEGMPPPVINKCNNASVKGLMIMCQHVSSPNHANVVLVAWLRGMLTLIPGKSAT